MGSRGIFFILSFIVVGIFLINGVFAQQIAENVEENRGYIESVSDGAGGAIVEYKDTTYEVFVKFIRTDWISEPIPIPTAANLEERKLIVLMDFVSDRMGGAIILLENYKGNKLYVNISIS